MVVIHQLLSFGQHVFKPNFWNECTTFPLIEYFMLSHGTNTQMLFCLKTPKREYWNSRNWDSYNFGGP
jgi:hypothetical protein